MLSFRLISSRLTSQRAALLSLSERCMRSKHVRKKVPRSRLVAHTRLEYHHTNRAETVKNITLHLFQASHDPTRRRVNLARVDLLSNAFPKAPDPRSRRRVAFIRPSLSRVLPSVDSSILSVTSTRFRPTLGASSCRVVRAFVCGSRRRVITLKV